jgi:hypothetical protein
MQLATVARENSTLALALKPSFNHVAAKMAKIKVWKTEKFLYSLKFQGHNSSKN